MAASSNSPCAACKFIRRKCTLQCVFAPYFPPDQPQKFANVHKIFGTSNVTKLLNELHPHQRKDAVNSLAYQADAWVKDPIYGCVGVISNLQHQVKQLQSELHNARSELSKYINAGTAITPMAGPSYTLGIGMELAGTSRHQIFRDQNIMDPHISRHHILRTNYEQAEIDRISGPHDPKYVPLATAGEAHLGVGIAAPPPPRGAGPHLHLNQYPRAPVSTKERTLRPHYTSRNLKNFI